MQRNNDARPAGRDGGFTLVELVVVMAVLAVLSGLILPKLDVFKLKANKSADAANIHGVDRYITQYKVQKDLFPDGWDSLMDAASTATLFTALAPELTGSTPGSPVRLTTTTITDQNELRSLQRVGITTVFDHNTGGFPPDSANGAARVLQVGDTVATINQADPDGQNIIARMYASNGGVVPAGRKVIVVGLGPRNQIVGDTLHEAPISAGVDVNSAYARYLVVFELRSSGSRARLIGTLGAEGNLLSDEIQDFYEN